MEEIIIRNKIREDDLELVKLECEICDSTGIMEYTHHGDQGGFCQCEECDGIGYIYYSENTGFYYKAKHILVDTNVIEVKKFDNPTEAFFGGQKMAERHMNIDGGFVLTTFRAGGLVFKVVSHNNLSHEDRNEIIGSRALVKA